MMPKNNDNLNNEDEKQAQETAEIEVADTTDATASENTENIEEPSLDDVQLDVLSDEIPITEISETTANVESNIEITTETESSEIKQDNSVQDEPITVQPIQFTSFENQEQYFGEANRNLDILMDIKLQLTVELGRTELPVRKVLELTRGSIIELQKVAGEPVELFANGKLVATGEVVVIEDNFGLRITSITDPEDRIKGI